MPDIVDADDPENSPELLAAATLSVSGHDRIMTGTPEESPRRGQPGHGTEIHRSRNANVNTSSPNFRQKRPSLSIGVIEEDSLEDDSPDDDDSGALIGPTSRKKVKVERYPCPFRKRDPLRFNIREWEYCAKAPFKTITDLK